MGVFLFPRVLEWQGNTNNGVPGQMKLHQSLCFTIGNLPTHLTIAQIHIADCALQTKVFKVWWFLLHERLSSKSCKLGVFSFASSRNRHGEWQSSFSHGKSTPRSTFILASCASSCSSAIKTRSSTGTYCFKGHFNNELCLITLFSIISKTSSSVHNYSNLPLPPFETALTTSLQPNRLLNAVYRMHHYCPPHSRMHPRHQVIIIHHGI